MAQSRIGKRPVELPGGVTVTWKEGLLAVKGPKGELKRTIPAGVTVTVEAKRALVAAADGLGRAQKPCHGLVRSLLANMVRGVTEGYEKKLQIQGVGYAFRLIDNNAVGFKGVFSFDRPFPLPASVKAELSDKDTVLTLRSIDNDALGRTAKNLRGLAPADRYKGKGVRFLGEQLTLKARKGAK
ncbi:MAG: 50S ribosomal protein L6 [Deltaproteobacteria bacterium]|nr:50S ribosomal protein L6 [Deltaproteobacteria bacterium]